MIIGRRIILILSLVAGFAIFAFGQIAQKKTPSQGPRAIAVLEWTSKGLQLVPVSILIDGQYYDAGIYEASPVPMSLQSETVYQVQKSGEPIGDFTVNTAQQWPNGNWTGNGKWDSYVEREKREAAKRAAKLHNSAGEEIDRPPVLRRHSESANAPASTPAPAPAASTPSAPASVPSSPAPSDSKESATADDSGRPILRRGNSGGEQATNIKDKELKVKVPAKPPVGIEKAQVAVSDATNNEVHPFTWKWANPEQEKKLTEQLKKLASSTVAGYAKKYNEAAPGDLQEVQIYAFDLTYNNEADVVLTATVMPLAGTPARQVHTTAKKSASKSEQKNEAKPASGKRDVEYYVTVVGREDIYGQLQQVFAQVTDNHHLDAFPRLQLIDAVDADGSGRGDLLFRSVSDTGSSFVIYRMSVAGLTELIKAPEPQL